MTNTTKQRVRDALLDQTILVLMPLTPAVFDADVYTTITGVKKTPADNADTIRFLNARDLQLHELERAGELR
jgi:hypothetical protein